MKTWIWWLWNIIRITFLSFIVRPMLQILLSALLIITVLHALIHRVFLSCLLLRKIFTIGVSTIWRFVILIIVWSSILSERLRRLFYFWSLWTYWLWYHYMSQLLWSFSLIVRVAALVLIILIWLMMRMRSICCCNILLFSGQLW